MSDLTSFKIIILERAVCEAFGRTPLNHSKILAAILEDRVGGENSKNTLFLTILCDTWLLVFVD